MYEPKEMDGVINGKFVDLLDEDRAIANQKFVCVSFVSPETVLKQKELFFFESFVSPIILSVSIIGCQPNSNNSLNILRIVG